MLNDKKLIDDLRSGSKEAFRELVEEFQDRVINTCYKFLNNKEDAEDTAQEVFVEVYRSLNSFREDSLLSTWIYRISVTKSLDLIRKKNRKKRFNFLKGGDDEELINWQPGDSDPYSILTDNERNNLLYTALNSLPDNQRIALTLSKLEHIKSSEIADIMNTNTSTVESWIHRAKKTLYKKLYKKIKNYY
jgi:RNA polymerase sigma-70 factor (ECF subfamily)